MDYQIESIKIVINSTDKRINEFQEGIEKNLANRNFTEVNLLKQQIAGLDSFKLGLEYALKLITEEI